MTPEQIKKHVSAVILAKLDTSNPRRAEALNDFLALSLPELDEGSAKNIAALVPELPQSIYLKWINLFAERLLETIPQNQLELLCNGAEDNNATLGLVYLMFMESARMEQQVAADLAELGFKSSGVDAQSDALALYLKARLQQKTQNAAATPNSGGKNA